MDERGVFVLQSWDEVGGALQFLSHEYYRGHRNPPKSWDLRLIVDTAKEIPKDQLVVDLGAAGLGATRLFYEMGFERVKGFDFSFSKFDRIIQFRDWLGECAKKKRPAWLPYTLQQRDLLKTGLRPGSVGMIACLSVIEHGVDMDAFFAEAHRMLRPGGRLFLSTDYWEPRLDTAGRKMFGLPWKVFCAEEIEEIISIGSRHGFEIGRREQGDLGCRDAVVRDLEHYYTFAAMRFQKTNT